MRDHQICPSPLCDHYKQCRSAMVGEPCVLDKLWQGGLAAGCGSSVTPCSYQRLNPYGLCEHCRDEDALSRELAEDMPFEPHILPAWRPDWTKFTIAGLVSLWWIAAYFFLISILHLFH